MTVSAFSVYIKLCMSCRSQCRYFIVRVLICNLFKFAPSKSDSFIRVSARMCTEVVIAMDEIHIKVELQGKYVLFNRVSVRDLLLLCEQHSWSTGEIK